MFCQLNERLLQYRRTRGITKMRQNSESWCRWRKSSNGNQKVQGNMINWAEIPFGVNPNERSGSADKYLGRLAIKFGDYPLFQIRDGLNEGVVLLQLYLIYSERTRAKWSFRNRAGRQGFRQQRLVPMIFTNRTLIHLSIAPTHQIILSLELETIFLFILLSRNWSK